MNSVNRKTAVLKILKKTGRYIGLSIAGFIVTVAIYMLCAFIFSRITVNKDFNEDSTDSSITIYLLTNGVHTDLVMPIRNELKDWSTALKTQYTKANDSTVQYVSFGWGDKGFYLNTPEWSDLTFGTAFKALFFLGTSAMHVTFYHQLTPNSDCKEIKIGAGQYNKLVAFVENSFELDTMGNYILIKNAPTYGQYDCFFEARRTYNLFYTCNTWTNGALKRSGLKACFWTPFDKGILSKYE